MPPIRPHHKTRTGCKTCKNRKVKCDEDFPICKNCTRRGIECVRSTTGTKHGSTALVRSMLGEQTSSNQDIATILRWTSTGSSDLLTLELIHHYSTSTSYSLSLEHGASAFWSNIIPKMAFDPRNQCLLHAILAFSALHIGHANSTSPFADRYISAASAYYYQAKRGLHIADTGETADINAVLIALSLVARYEFATSAVAFPSLASDWYFTIRAIRRNIHEKDRTQLESSVLCSLFAAMAPSLLFTSLEEEFPSSLSTLLSTTHPAPDVEELNDVSIRTAYEDSISYLERAWKAPLNESVGIWWYIMPNAFFQLLKEGRPRALIILAHYCVMMKRVTQEGRLWWAKKQWGNEAARIISLLDARWTPWLGWLSSQLDEVHNTQALDFAGIDFLSWLNEASMQEAVIGQTISGLHTI
ncbi:uncharacterized protein EV420DRAFT_1767359 [Desarmillaria tabescens]|uniref:Zn(2)-C6 fungal-type domain-containing protein n=1 Tax=Armillaria tabescens TaxID=1929756 RepID=A0AA39MW75_ARMTA|nr:uncharacterized protein EV420DRAFT_1767359 [Desarmillaria tabescens]KAK0448339.1 hypothetical protein EV420DRAFT_1767359 [Desarmillaria tabescens]